MVSAPPPVISGIEYSGCRHQDTPDLDSRSDPSVPMANADVTARPLLHRSQNLADRYPLVEPLQAELERVAGANRSVEAEFVPAEPRDGDGCSQSRATAQRRTHISCEVADPSTRECAHDVPESVRLGNLCGDASPPGPPGQTTVENAHWKCPFGHVSTSGHVASCVSTSRNINAFNPLPAYVAGDGPIGSRTLDAIRSRSNTQPTRDS
jgi:hypothetical protein